MKSCIALLLLLCLLLGACSMAGQNPTESQLQFSSTISMHTTVPTTDPASCNPTTMPATIPSTVRPTEKPTHIHSMLPTSRVTVKPTTPTAMTTSVAKSQLVRIQVGEQSIVPISVVTSGRYYYEENNEWVTLGCGPVLFDQYEDSRIPAVILTAPVQLILAENVDKNVGLWVQTDKKAYTGEPTTLEGLSNLLPGTYYVRISILERGEYVAGEHETTTYQLGFKLIVP